MRRLYSLNMQFSCFISTLKDERNKHTALRTIRRVNLRYYLDETFLDTKTFADWNFTNRLRSLAWRQLRMWLISAIFNRSVLLENNSTQYVTMPIRQFHP